MVRFVIRPRKIRRDGKEYIEYYVYVPKDLARKLFVMAGMVMADHDAKIVLDVDIRRIDVQKKPKPMTVYRFVGDKK